MTTHLIQVQETFWVGSLISHADAGFVSPFCVGPKELSFSCVEAELFGTGVIMQSCQTRSGRIVAVVWVAVCDDMLNGLPKSLAGDSGTVSGAGNED